MNYGYHELSGHFISVNTDEIYCLQLYHFISSAFFKFSDLKGLKLIEIGSGRGGGLKYVTNVFKPHTAIGIDYSQSQVNFSNANNRLANLKFIQGDAENIPIASDSVDFLINIESSHCYGDFHKFLTEVARVLKKKGNFLYADFMNQKEMEIRESWFGKCGLKVIEKKDVTQNVLLAMELENPRKIEAVKKAFGWFGKKAFSEFIGVKDSIIYNKFAKRETLYLAYHLIKHS